MGEGKELFLKILRERLNNESDFLYVPEGSGKLLIPGSQEYNLYQGLETGGLASCFGIALYFFYKDEGTPWPWLGLIHLNPSKDFLSMVEALKDQAISLGKVFDPRNIIGFSKVIRGQTTYEKEYLESRFNNLNNLVQETFPQLQPFPSYLVFYSVLRGHLSIGVRLLKNGRLIIEGEGKAY